MAEEEVPCYFLCPISLHIMLDPVTLPSGITYDREGIERWLLTAGTCPLTKQPVPADCEPTPNHTLRRLIQAWCKLHDVVPVVSPPTTNRPRTDRARVASLLSHIDDDDGDALRELREVAAESELNRKLIAAVPGAVDALIAALTSSSSSAAAADGALEIVSSLELSSDQRLVRVVETNGAALVDALVSALQRCSSSREHAARFLAEATVAMSPTRLASLPDQVFREAVRLLRDRVSTKPALRVLVGATPWGRNRVKAVDAGAVAAVVDLLLDSTPEQQQQRRSACELALGALERMCGCAEGRAELVAHAAGVAAVGNVALLGVSDVATDRAVRVVRAVARHAATPAVLHEMLQSGVVAALCVVAQSSERFGERTRERARETLRMHARAWRNSPCLHRHLQAMYPAC